MGYSLGRRASRYTFSDSRIKCPKFTNWMPLTFSEQYDLFVKFTYDQIQKKFEGETASCKPAYLLVHALEENDDNPAHIAFFFLFRPVVRSAA